jgi:hypothetical protein
LPQIDLPDDHKLSCQTTHTANQSQISGILSALGKGRYDVRGASRHPDCRLFHCPRTSPENESFISIQYEGQNCDSGRIEIVNTNVDRHDVKNFNQAIETDLCHDDIENKQVAESPIEESMLLTAFTIAFSFLRNTNSASWSESDGINEKVCASRYGFWQNGFVQTTSEKLECYCRILLSRSQFGTSIVRTTRSSVDVKHGWKELTIGESGKPNS